MVAVETAGLLCKQCADIDDIVMPHDWHRIIYELLFNLKYLCQ